MGKQKTGGGGGGDDAKREQPLQAVLLADSFTRSFRPLSLDKSKVLCPLNNVTMIDYAIEFLAGAGVEELFVVCLRDEVEEHVKNNQWTKSLMQLTVVKDSSLTNAGDALRELDKSNMVQSDPFILMYGDTVTNVDIKPALVAHKERHKKDSSAMMTLLMKEVGGWKSEPHTAYSSLKPAQDDLIIGLDPSQDNRILVYDDRASSKTSTVPCSFFTSHSEIDLRCDLLDCGIDICSPDVLARFSDEFDYRDIRREFVHNSVAEEEEGLQNKIFCHLLKTHEYAARVHDFATYDAISRDLLQRWCYPVVPDNLPSGYERNFRYAVQRHFVYREMKQGHTKIGRSTVLKGPSMVGSHCIIGDNSLLEATVVGHECQIGSNVTLKGCHLWGKVMIEDGVTVRQSILAQDVVIRAGAKIGVGCVIGRGCIIGKGVVLPDFSKITLKKDTDDEDDDGFDDFGEDTDDDDDDDSEEGKSEDDDALISDHALVGPDGQGHVWKQVIDDDDFDDDDDDSPIDILEVQSIGFDRTELYKERTELQKEAITNFDDAGMMSQNIEDYGDGALDFGGESSVSMQGILPAGRQRGIDVVKELKIICMEHEDTAPIENLSIELNSFKFSQNATYSDCTMAATLTIMEKMNIMTSMTAGKLVAGLKTQLERWSPLLKKMSIGVEEEKSIILGLERAAMSEGEMGDTLSTEPNFRFMLQTLHDEEIVSEEAVLAWAATHCEDDPTSALGKIFYQKPTQDFLEWLAEESDSEEDEDSDEEGSEEEDSD